MVVVEIEDWRFGINLAAANNSALELEASLFPLRVEVGCRFVVWVRGGLCAVGREGNYFFTAARASKEIQFASGMGRNKATMINIRQAARRIDDIGDRRNVF